MITPGILKLVLKFPSISGPMSKDVGVATKGLYKILRSHAIILLKSTAVIGTMAVVAVVETVPRVTFGAFWALMLMAMPMMNSDNKVEIDFIF